MSGKELNTALPLTYQKPLWIKNVELLSSTKYMCKKYTAFHAKLLPIDASKNAKYAQPLRSNYLVWYHPPARCILKSDINSRYSLHFPSAKPQRTPSSLPTNLRMSHGHTQWFAIPLFPFNLRNRLLNLFFALNCAIRQLLLRTRRHP
jgi:hypothetical protein